MTADRQDGSSGPIRILMTADAVGGVWQYSLDLISQLTQQRFEVLLAILGPHPSNEQRAQAKSIPGLKVAEGGYSLEWMPDSWSDVDASGKWLLELQSNFGADIIHLNGFSHAALSWKQPVLVVAHSCVRSWWRAVHGCAPGPEWDEYCRRVSRGLAACARVTAPSRHMADCIHSEYGISEDKISVIRNFTLKADVVHTWKSPFILAAGRFWDAAKNVSLLNRIAPQLAWEICLAGSARESDCSSSSSRNITCLGSLPHSELLRSMESAAIFAHPALYEPFGLVALEAARARCSLVLSDIPSLRELWDGAAVFIDPRDSDAWMRELNCLTEDKSRREELGNRAQMHAGRYTAQATVEQYVALYSSLLGIGSEAKGAAA